MANRIKDVRKSVTLEELAERTGISVSFLSRMQSGKRGLKLEDALKIAKALNVDVSDISDEFDQSDIIEIERRYERAKSAAREKRESAALDQFDIMDVGRATSEGDIPNLNIHAGMGPGGALSVLKNESGQVYSDEVSGFWSFPDVVKAGWRHMPAVYAMPVTGDSMEPTLMAGSHVFVDTTHTVPSPEDIYAIDYGDGLMIKRIKLVPRSDKVLVISDNERYGTDTLLRSEVRVYGRVVAYFQWRG